MDASANGRRLPHTNERRSLERIGIRTNRKHVGGNQCCRFENRRHSQIAPDRKRLLLRRNASRRIVPNACPPPSVFLNLVVNEFESYSRLFEKPFRFSPGMVLSFANYTGDSAADYQHRADAAGCHAAVKG